MRRKLTTSRDAVVQEDFMKACRKLNDAKKHEGAMSVFPRVLRVPLISSISQGLSSSVATVELSNAYEQVRTAGDSASLEAGSIEIERRGFLRTSLPPGIPTTSQQSFFLPVLLRSLCLSLLLPQAISQRRRQQGHDTRTAEI